MINVTYAKCTEKKLSSIIYDPTIPVGWNYVRKVKDIIV